MRRGGSAGKGKKGKGKGRGRGAAKWIRRKVKEEEISIYFFPSNFHGSRS